MRGFSLSVRRRRRLATSHPDAPRPGIRDLLLWIALAACGSALLLSTTNQLTLDVAVVPFLWVLPLSLYLLSFIFCFDHDRWYVRPLFCALLPVVVMNVVLLLQGGIHLMMALASVVVPEYSQPTRISLMAHL